jgi:hypothetical protein
MTVIDRTYAIPLLSVVHGDPRPPAVSGQAAHRAEHRCEFISLQAGPHGRFRFDPTGQVLTEID